MFLLETSQKNFVNGLSNKGKRWIFKEENQREVLSLIQKHGYPEILARLISQRCPAEKDPESFLSAKLRDSLPDPFSFQDMRRSVDRLIQALEGKEKITIFGDYDVDGATSTSLLVNYLSYLKADINFYIPDRIKEGYGPSAAAFDQLKSQGTQLIITVDCGTTAFDPLRYAKDLGIDVIVIDHHIPEMELPEAYAIVNPNRKDDLSGYGYLCAAGVTFLVLVGINSVLKKTRNDIPDLKAFLDLVALGTICDVVPLKELNRAFVKQGLCVLNQNLNLGLKALSHVAGIEGPCTPYHLGYILGPHINAGGRIGTSTLGTQLLTSSSLEFALPIAQELKRLNTERKEIEAKALAQAIETSASLQDKSFICIGLEAWHPGIIGIVAGRIKEIFYKPTFVIAFDESGVGKGSGRSVPGINLGVLVQKAKDAGLILSGGGHAMAAGLTVEKTKMKDLTDFFNQEVTFAHEAPILEIDGTLHVQGANIDLVRMIDQVGPFGAENPPPLFMIPNCEVINPQIRGQKHVSCFLRSESGSSLEAMCFNALGTGLEKIFLQGLEKPCHVVGSLKIDSWQGREKVKFYIEDALKSE